LGGIMYSLVEKSFKDSNGHLVQYSILPFSCASEKEDISIIKNTDNPSIAYDFEIMMIVDYRHSEMYKYV
jgi:hypothetical protein